MQEGSGGSLKASDSTTISCCFSVVTSRLEAQWITFHFVPLFLTLDPWSSKETTNMWFIYVSLALSTTDQLLLWNQGSFINYSFQYFYCLLVIFILWILKDVLYKFHIGLCHQYQEKNLSWYLMSWMIVVTSRYIYLLMLLVRVLLKTSSFLYHFKQGNILAFICRNYSCIPLTNLQEVSSFNSLVS